MIAVLLGLILGILIGWYAREIRRILSRMAHYLKPPVQPETGVVRPRSVVQRQIRKAGEKLSGVVRAKTPKQVAIETERRFREETGI